MMMFLSFLYIRCAMRHQDDFRRALTAAVNQGGDSDSTGAITGNILGAYVGMERIPAEWTSRVELLDVLTQVADEPLYDKNVMISHNQT